MSFNQTKLSFNSEAIEMHDFLNMEDMDIDKVDQAMKSMDKKFNTQFYIWIRNENNVDYISYYLRRVIVQYEQQNFHSIYRAIRWLVNGWSVQRTAELLIKLFYHWGVGDHKFANLVKNITINWPLQPTLIDLVVTLVIGERSSKTARFIYQLTTGWSLSQKLELIHAVSTRLRWSERYFKHFLLQLACLGERSWESKRSLVNSIRQSFNSRKILLQQINSTKVEESPNDMETKKSTYVKTLETLELVVFSCKILKRILELDINTINSSYLNSASFIHSNHSTATINVNSNYAKSPMAQSLQLSSDNDRIITSPKMNEASNLISNCEIDGSITSPTPSCKMVLT